MRFRGTNDRRWAVLAAGFAGLAAGAVIAGGAIAPADHTGQPLAATPFMQGGGAPPAPAPAPAPDPGPPPGDPGAPAPDAPADGQQQAQPAPGLPFMPGGF